MQSVNNRLLVSAKGSAPATANRGRPATAERRETIQRVQFEQEGPAGGVQQAVPAATAVPNGGTEVNQRMAERIAQALKSARFQGYDIEIQYQSGVVMLGGSVASMQHKATATSIVSQVPGVQRVDNRLTVMRDSRAPIRVLAVRTERRRQVTVRRRQVMGRRQVTVVRMAPLRQVMVGQMERRRQATAVREWHRMPFTISRTCPSMPGPRMLRTPTTPKPTIRSSTALPPGRISVRSIPIPRCRWDGGRLSWNGMTVTGI